MIRKFLNAMSVAGKSENTIRGYSSDLNAYQDHLGRPIETSTVDDIEQYFLSIKKLAPATKGRKQVSLRVFFTWAVRRDFLQANPMDKIDPVKVPSKLPRPMASGSVKNLLVKIGEEAFRDRLLIILMLETGLRASEAIRIRMDDIDFTAGDEKLYIVGKGGDERQFPLYIAKLTLTLLPEYIKAEGIKSGYIFKGETARQHLSYSTAHRAWMDFASRAGISDTKGLHVLRHTFASGLLEKGVTMEVIQYLLGHKQITTTQRYAAMNSSIVKTQLTNKLS